MNDGPTPLLEPADEATFNILIEEVEALQRDLEREMRAAAKEDFTPEEQERLKTLAHKVRDQKRKILDHLNAVRARSRGENVFTDSEVFSTQEDGPTGVPNAREMDTGADLLADDLGIKPFDHADFRENFLLAMRNLRDMGKSALQSAELDMFTFEGDEKEFQTGGFWGVVKKVLKKHPYGAAFVKGYEAVENAIETYEAYKRSGSESIPPVNFIRTQLEKKFDLLALEPAVGEAFAAFIEEWKKQNGYPSAVTDVYAAEFAPACLNAASGPDMSSDVKKAFLTMLMENSEDTRHHDTDKDSDHAEMGMPDAGYLDIFEETKDGKLHKQTFQLNDVDKPIVQSIKQTWGSEPMVNLPCPVRFRERHRIARGMVVDVVVDIETVRTSKVPGDLTLNVASYTPGAQNNQGLEKSLEKMEGLLTRTPISKLK